MYSSTEEVWVATLEVVPMPGNTSLGDALGAFVTVMAMASSPRDFRRKLYEYMESAKFDILDIRDAEPLELREEFVDLDNELKFVKAAVSRTREAAAGPYNAFAEDDED